MPEFYIAFATDAGCRGATIVRAADAAGALREATWSRRNPGGGAAILRLPEGIDEIPGVAVLRSRLVLLDELTAFNAGRVADLPADVQAGLGQLACVVPPDLNPAGEH